MPFVALGLGAGKLVRGLRVLERHHRWIVGVSGSVLIVAGALMAAGTWTRIVAPLGRWATGL